MRRSKRFVQNTVQYVLQEKNHFKNLVTLTSHDYYTYTHSVHVCVYSLALAKAIGISNEVTLHEIGFGGLLHDVGKSTIPLEILMKPGRFLVGIFPKLDG